MNFLNKRVLKIVCIIICAFFFLRIMHLSDEAINTFVIGVTIGMIIMYLHEKEGFLKNVHEYPDDLNSMLATIYNRCFFDNKVRQQYVLDIIVLLDKKSKEFRTEYLARYKD